MPIDAVQFVLLLVIIALTILLVILGVQVFLILRDVRQTIIKTNKVLDTAGSITENIRGPLSTLSALALGVKASSFLTVARVIKGFLGKDKDGEEKKHHRE